MSYEPTVWKDGDLVTSAKLNKLEQGVVASGSGGVLVVHGVEGTLDKTWKEIHDAGFAVAYLGDVYSMTVGIYGEVGEYSVIFWNPETHEIVFITDSENGYPILLNESDEPQST